MINDRWMGVCRCGTHEDGLLLSHLFPVLLQQGHGHEAPLQQPGALRQAAGETRRAAPRNELKLHKLIQRVFTETSGEGTKNTEDDGGMKRTGSLFFYSLGCEVSVQSVTRMSDQCLKWNESIRQF